MDTKKFFKYSFFIILFIVGLFFSYHYAYADWLSDPLGSVKESAGGVSIDPQTLITKIINAIFTFAEIAFVVMFLIAGVMYITASGNEESAGKARQMILQAVIGIVIVFSAWGIATWILTTLKSGGENSNTAASGAPKATETPAKATPAKTK